MYYDIQVLFVKNNINIINEKVWWKKGRKKCI